MADPETEGLRSTFPSYMAEGERLYLCGEFAKAAHSFSNVSPALNLSATHYWGPADAWTTLLFPLFHSYWLMRNCHR